MQGTPTKVQSLSRMHTPLETSVDEKEKKPKIQELYD
jgi:hypothetical protein